MSRVVILGYGNPLRGDDAVGWLAAQELQRRLADDEIEVVAAHQLNPEHAELVAKAGLAIFMDASADAPAGTITRVPVFPADKSARPSTHNLTPGALLACARELYGTYPDAVLFAVGARDFACGEISKPVVDSLPVLVAQVAGFCATHTRVGTSPSLIQPSTASS